MNYLTKQVLQEIVQEAIEEETHLLSENIKEGVRFKFGSQEMEFGSPEHLKVLKVMLHGLQSLRDCYHLGSANRHVYSSACHKLKRLITKHSSAK